MGTSSQLAFVGPHKCGPTHPVCALKMLTGGSGCDRHCLYDKNAKLVVSESLDGSQKLMNQLLPFSVRRAPSIEFKEHVRTCRKYPSNPNERG